MKTYKIKGIEYYATECRGLFHALVTFLTNKCGVTENDIEEFTSIIHDNAVKVFEGV
jgi:hypothetical protein